MKEETITKYVDKLADSLNVASEHVYEALIKQAMVSGISSIIWAALSLVVIIGIVVIAYLFDKSSRETSSFYDTGDTIMISFITSMVLILPILFFGCAVDNALTALLNPEYWAIKEIIDAVKN